MSDSIVVKLLLCIDCQHYQPTTGKCIKQKKGEYDLVSGKKLDDYDSYWFASVQREETQRGNSNSCGPEAKWFEPRGA